MKTNQFTPEESILILKKMQEEFIVSLKEDGKAWIIQSSVAIILALLHFVLAKLGYTWSPLVWLGMFVSGIYVYYLNRGKEKNIKSKLGDILKQLWTAFAISLLLVIPILIFAELYDYIFTFCFILYGFALFANASVIKFKPMVYSAVFCWAMSIACLFVHGANQLLILALVMAFGFLMPGLLLNREFKNQTSE